MFGLSLGSLGWRVVAIATALAGCSGLHATPRAEQAVVNPPAPRAAAAGEVCTRDGNVACADPTSALLCRGGALVAIRCLGPGGCERRGDASKCHDGVREVGDTCIEPMGESNTACTSDGAREVMCKGGRDELNRTCRGPKACKVDGDTVLCDDAIGEIGDRCAFSLAGDNYGCTVDGAKELICDARSRQYSVYSVCRGPDHCQVIGDRISCDENIGRVGEPCVPVSNLTCAEDAGSELECSEVGTWAKAKDCKKSPCAVRNHTIYCDD